MERLRRITYRFPEHVAGTDEFMSSLSALLSLVPGLRTERAMIYLEPSQPAGALPITALTLAPVATPEIAFAMKRELNLTLGSLRLHSNVAVEATSGLAVVIQGDQPGRLPMATISARLAGHITHVDHTGVNLPKTLVSGERWDELLQSLAQETTLYRYPDDEPWPFILPASDEEYRDDIRAFAMGRFPKFELVHDGWATLPVLQFSLGTDLSREELEAVLPDPYGVAFPDLGHIFRTVYVDHPWPNLLIRLDLNCTGPITDWDTGEWLVKAGGRFSSIFANSQRPYTAGMPQSPPWKVCGASEVAEA